MKVNFKQIKESKPWKLTCGIVATGSSLMALWGNFWLGHLLQDSWPPSYWFISWWIVPFGITTGITLSLFANSLSYLTTAVKRRLQ